MRCTHFLARSIFPTPQTLEGLRLRVEGNQLKHLSKAPFYSVIADECTDIATIEEELSHNSPEDGEPVENFFTIEKS